MAKGYSIPLRSVESRTRACQLIAQAPDGYICKVEQPTRTLSQNAKMHAMLSDVAMSTPNGRRMTPDEWKAAFMAACGWECQFIEGLNGRPLPIGYRSSKMSKTQMSDLIDFMQAWGDENGVRWTPDE
jgi:hypothetical protein